MSGTCRALAPPAKVEPQSPSPAPLSSRFSFSSSPVSTSVTLLSAARTLASPAAVSRGPA